MKDSWGKRIKTALVEYNNYQKYNCWLRNREQNSQVSLVSDIQVWSERDTNFTGVTCLRHSSLVKKRYKLHRCHLSKTFSFGQKETGVTRLRHSGLIRKRYKLRRCRLSKTFRFGQKKIQTSQVSPV